MDSTYQTDFCVTICGGYDIDGTLHHDGRRIEAIELHDGTSIEADCLDRSRAYSGHTPSERHIYALIAAEVVATYGADLLHLEWERPNRAADRADREHHRIA